ncbi:MAG: HigA family addiction module antidote protein [Hyphomicrobiales bacterium]|nr:HigA family addiction module antidote protein [Hyphomicrobiales bacterium]
MSQPPHPGQVIRELCLEPLGLDESAADQALAVPPGTVLALLDGRIGISPDMAVRLSEVFGGMPESWLQQQNHYDLWCVRQRQGRIALTRWSQNGLAATSPTQS